uniref:Uncharacterized protein n=1 Tax=Meloidogyne enterolobii TaxID=390850 RepID=A0A6V7WMX6_MELEN|nr:unnamed protein product [Meloidogyne enterolobii]
MMCQKNKERIKLDEIALINGLFDYRKINCSICNVNDSAANDLIDKKIVKCKFEKELNGSKSHMTIGLRNCSTNNYIYYYAKYGYIYGQIYGSFQLSTFSFNNNDIFGCGLVYPPTNRTNEFPYVFFTQNGKQIGTISIHINHVFS